MIGTNGQLSDDLKKDGWIACEVKECSICCGSGWSESGYAAEGKPGERFYGAAKEGTKCGGCEGTGYILNLSTAIACKVTTTVERKRNVIRRIVVT